MIFEEVINHLAECIHVFRYKVTVLETYPSQTAVIFFTANYCMPS